MLNSVERRDFRTLADARAALRAANGGRLHGSFSPAKGDSEDDFAAIEGWNLGRNEDCATAIIFTPVARG
jgi:hypothetical protein